MVNNVEINDFIEKLCEEHPYKIVISNPKDKKSDIRKIDICEMEMKSRRGYQVEKFTEKQAFHINIEETDLTSVLSEYFSKDFMQISAWTKDFEYQGKITSKGKLLQNRKQNKNAVTIRVGNNKEKQYCIPEGKMIPPLIDMGVFTAEGKVVRTMYDKYRQINRYLEIVEDILDQLPKEQINIIDFGCGKSYLTFLLYYYLVEVKHRDVDITGLDLKEQVIRDCQNTAQKYHYDHLHFQVGDIATYQSEKPVHMVISLHACDTATDYALYHAINWNAKVILSVPCCQHEVNKQMEKTNLSILSRYGILKERTAAIMTDAVRANLLEYMGYKTQVMEFINMEHSPKNLLIRAVKSNVAPEKREQMLAEVEELRDTFGITPTLYHLLCQNEGQAK